MKERVAAVAVARAAVQLEVEAPQDEEVVVELRVDVVLLVAEVYLVEVVVVELLQAVSVVAVEEAVVEEADSE